MPRVEQFELRFNNTDAIYLAGQVVSGSVVIELSRETWIKTIRIKFSGRAKAKWDVSSGDTSKHYQATEVYIDSEYQLFRCRDENDSQPPGMHVYPFDFTLPTDVPSSFEGRRGYVRYQCIVTMDRGWKGVLEIEQDLTVIRHLDLNALPRAAMPQNLHRVEMYEGCCCDSGNVEARLKLQKSGFVSGEPMFYDMTINNKATSSICGIVMQLVQTVRYTGYSDSMFSSGNPKYHDKVNSWVIFQTDDEVGAGKTGVYTSYCIIPAVAPSLLEGCNIIDIMYEIRLEVPVGWRTVQLGCNIFIGTIPLRHLSPDFAVHIDGDDNSRDLDLIALTSRGNHELPPSYEECVFGRMESQERDDNDIDDDDEQDQLPTTSENSTAASRRSRFHRLPSYPYYSTDQFMSSENGYQPQQINTYPYPPPHPVTSSGYTSIPITEQPTSSSLPPPPSYESLQLQH